MLGNLKTDNCGRTPTCRICGVTAREYSVECIGVSHNGEMEMCETINHLLCGWCNKFVIQKNHLSAKIELFRLLFNERKGDFNGKSNKVYGTYKMDV